MNLINLAEPLHTSDSNLSGSSFRDINMSGSEISTANLQRLVLRDVDRHGRQPITVLPKTTKLTKEDDLASRVM